MYKKNVDIYRNYSRIFYNSVWIFNDYIKVYIIKNYNNRTIAIIYKIIKNENNTY